MVLKAEVLALKCLMVETLFSTNPPTQFHQGTEVCFHRQTCTTMHHNGYQKTAYFLFSSSLIMTKHFQILKPDEMYIMQKFMPFSKGRELRLTCLTYLTSFPQTTKMLQWRESPLHNE